MCRDFIVLLLILQVFPSHSMRTGIGEKQRKSAYIDGDFIIGVLFPVHEPPLLNGSNDPLVCGMIRERYGIQRIEAAFWAIDSINNDSSILPGIKLGINIKDGCSSESVALHQTIKLIEEPIPRNNHADDECTCSHLNDHPTSPLIGIIGPGYSTGAITVQNLLKLFKIPQIGYSATSTELLDLRNYPYYLRVNPSDDFQARLMHRILNKFNWNYVSIVYTNTNYGQSGMKALRKYALEFGICIAQMVGIESSDEDFLYENALQDLQEDCKAKVILCFCEGLTVQGLLKAIRRRNLTNEYQLIGSEGWASRYSVIEDYEEEAQGSLIIRLKTHKIPEFEDYFLPKNLLNNKRNPWFAEFWEYRFGCKINVTENSGDKKCSGTENLRNNYYPDLILPYVIKSVYALAHGLHNMRADVCKNKSLLCEDLYPFNSTQFLDHLSKVNFTFYNEMVNFSAFRTPWKSRYDVYNLQKMENGSHHYVKVGDYEGNYAGHLDYNYDENFFEYINLHGPIQFPGGGTQPVKSICSDPCPPGQIQLSRSTGQDKTCCWNCVPCNVGEFQFNLTSCQRCPIGYWPNQNQTKCNEVILTYTHWMDPQSLISLGFSFIGIFLTSMTAYIFIKYRETPVVKSSTKELCYIMLVGMIMAHSVTFAVVAKPTLFTCTISRIISPISFTIIYAALLVKTNRIARILSSSKKKFPNLNPRFMSVKAQITITSILVAIETIICGVMLIKEPPIPFNTYGVSDNQPYAHLICPVSPRAIFIPFSFVAFLVVMCTSYAIKTRNLPDNFNEAKFIGFSMYVTCITWVAFGLIYYGSEFQVVTSCVCASTNSLVILTFLFFPKLYIIIFAPEKNSRAYFTTCKGIRCIIGRKDSYQDGHKSKLWETDFRYIAECNQQTKNFKPERSSINSQEKKLLS